MLSIPTSIKLSYSKKIAESLNNDEIKISQVHLQNIIVQLNNPKMGKFIKQKVIECSNKSQYQTYLSSVFRYQTCSIANPAVLQSEYKRNDFYDLIIKVPWDDRNEKYTLTLIDLTNIGFPYMRHENIICGEDGYLKFDILGDKVINPIKKFNWIHSIEDAIGNTIRLELQGQTTGKKLVKYLFLDYFSPENYSIAILEIANYYKEVHNLPFNKKEEEESSQSESNSEILEEDFTDLKHRIKTLGNKLLRFTKVGFGDMGNLTISGTTIIEFKNCIIKALSFDSFSVLIGEAPLCTTERGYENYIPPRQRSSNSKICKTANGINPVDDDKPLIVERRPKIFIKGCQKVFAKTAYLGNAFPSDPKLRKKNKAFEIWKNEQIIEGPFKPTELYLGVMK